MFRNGGSCGCYDVCGWGLWGDTHRRYSRSFLRFGSTLRLSARPILIRATALALLGVRAALALLRALLRVLLTLLLLRLLLLVLLALVLLVLLAALILLRAVLLTLVLLALVLLIAICHGSSLPVRGN